MTFLALAAFQCISAYSSYAQLGYPLSVGTVQGDRLNVRGRPSFAGEILTQLRFGAKVDIHGVITRAKPKEGEPDTWLQIKLPDDIPVWVSELYINDNMEVTADVLNLRGGPSEAYSQLGTLKRGHKITPLEKVDGWIKLNAPLNTTGYVAAEFVSYSVGPDPDTSTENIVFNTNQEVPQIKTSDDGKTITIEDPTLVSGSGEGATLFEKLDNQNENTLVSTNTIPVEQSGISSTIKVSGEGDILSSTNINEIISNIDENNTSSSEIIETVESVTPTETIIVEADRDPNLGFFPGNSNSSIITEPASENLNETTTTAVEETTSNIVIEGITTTVEPELVEEIIIDPTDPSNNSSTTIQPSLFESTQIIEEPTTVETTINYGDPIVYSSEGTQEIRNPINTETTPEVKPQPKINNTVLTPITRPGLDPKMLESARIVIREGIIKGTLNARSPTHYSLVNVSNRRVMNFLWAPQYQKGLKNISGQKVVIQGKEFLDRRWPKTPVLRVEKIRIFPK